MQTNITDNKHKNKYVDLPLHEIHQAIKEDNTLFPIAKNYKTLLLDSLEQGIDMEATMSQQDIDEQNKVAHILMSYFYYPKRKSILQAYEQFKGNKHLDIMIDSGVFTFRKHNADVCIDTYIKYLNSIADLINYAVTLDYPHDAETIMKNTDYIQQRLDPRITLVPVIQTFIFNEAQIEETLSKYKFICLGTYDGIHGSIMYTPEVEASINKVYEINKKYNRVLHGLGRTKIQWLKNQKLESSDSSGWARYMFTGNTVLWDAKKNDIRSFSTTNKAHMIEYAEYYEKRFGIKELSFMKMIKDSKTLHIDSYPHNALCVLAYLLVQELLRRKLPNYRCFLATSNPKNFKSVDRASDLFYNRKF